VLLKCHKQFEGVVKKMGKSGLMNGGEKAMSQKMQRNPQVGGTTVGCYSNLGG